MDVRGEFDDRLAQRLARSRIDGHIAPTYCFKDAECVHGGIFYSGVAVDSTDTKERLVFGVSGEQDCEGIIVACGCQRLRVL